ncbi:MAG: histidinol-phosphatase [Hyphomicrobiaceae bacterium]
MTTASTAPGSVADLEAFAHHLADLSGNAILPLFRTRLEIEDKAEPGGARSFDPVTAGDRAAETVMREAITRAHPTHGIVGEEFGTEAPDAAYKWVLDPIDGTRAFILGLPVWGTLIGLTEKDRTILGLMNQPFTRERFWAAGGAAKYRGPDGCTSRLRTRACRALADAQLSSTHPELFAPGEEAEGFARIRQATRATRYGADCYAYCLVAAGHIDLVVEAGLKPYDVVALIPIVEAAGGVITTWDGGPATGGGRIIAAGDPELHRQACAVLAGR